MPKPKAEQLTTWGRATEQMDTQFGRVSYRDWCRLEADRIRAHGTEAVVVTRGSRVCVVKG